MKMSKAEPGHWNGIANGNNGYDNFHDLLSILDFPMESLEGEDFVEDWDATNLQCLGPIPTDALTDLHTPPQSCTANVSSGAAIKFEASADSISQQNRLLNYGNETSRGTLLCPNKYSEDHKSGIFVSERRALYSGKKIPIKPDFIVPVRSRSKRTRSSNVNPWLLISSSFSTAPKYIRPPQVNQVSDPCTPPQQSTPVEKCAHCEVTETPQWREGPLGPRTLCNACGVRYRSGRLCPEYRPAASPTFGSKNTSTAKTKTTFGSKNTSTAKTTTTFGSENTSTAKTKAERKSPHKSITTKYIRTPEVNQVSDNPCTPRVTFVRSSAPVKKCAHCEITKTPQWREGPLGPRTLCNACGVRYRSGRLFPEYRPAASPTFVPSLHSNSHKVVAQMRRKSVQEPPMVNDTSNANHG